MDCMIIIFTKILLVAFFQLSYKSINFSMDEQFNDEPGFLQKSTLQTSINSLSKSSSDIQNKKKSYLKWKEVKSQIIDMKINGGEQQRKLIRMVRCGIEDSIRNQIWPLLVNEPIKSYEYFKGKNQNKEISLDLERTFPNYKNSKQLQHKMKLVLNALAMAIPDLGYCQGMNFIVGTILMRLSEEQCYKVAFHILHWQKHDLLLKKLDIIHQKLYALGRINKKAFPKTIQDIKKLLNLTYSLCVILVYYTILQLFAILLYASYFRMLYAGRYTWIKLGEKILYRVALQILKIKKRNIKSKKNVQDIVDEIKNYSDLNQKQIDIFFEQMFQRPLSRDQIDSYTKKYREEQVKKILD